MKKNKNKKSAETIKLYLRKYNLII